MLVYKKFVDLVDGSEHVIGAEGVRDIQRTDTWVTVFLGNGNIYSYPREQVKVYVETPLQVEV